MTNLELLLYAAQTKEDWIFLAKSFSIEEIAKQFNCTVSQVMVKVNSK